MNYFRLVKARSCCGGDIITYFNLDFQQALIQSEDTTITDIFEENYVFTAQTYHNLTTLCWEVIEVLQKIDYDYPFVDTFLYNSLENVCFIILV